MTRVSLDVEELKKTVRATALTARTRLTEFAKKAQTDFSQKELRKKMEQVLELVKSQDFMKNPNVKELAAKITVLAEQVEQLVKKNAGPFVQNVKTKVKNAAAKSGKSGKKAKKNSTKKDSAN